MKISELTENDCIHISTKKEAKGISDLLKKEGIKYWKGKQGLDLDRATKQPIQVYKDEYGTAFNYWESNDSDKNIIPASKFLKQSISKKDLQEALSKVGEELSSMNERLGKLEAKSEPKTANGIEIHFDEVTEGLPEKWCVVADEDNIAEISVWFSKNKQYESDTNFFDPRFISNDNHFHFPKYANNHCYSFVAEGYEEITFETFKKYVLKEEVKEAVGLEVNRWYKDTREGSKALFYIESIVNPVGHQDLTIFSYGFTMSGDWSEGCLRNNSVFTKYFIPATESEVFEALKAEAENRGFKEGVVIESLNGKGHLKLRNEPTFLEYRLIQNDLVCSSNTMYLAQIFHNGQWATIIPQPEIDFSKAGQLVESKKWGCVIMTSGRQTLHHFTGTYVVTKKDDIGKTFDSIIKEGLTLCTEPVTLSN